MPVRLRPAVLDDAKALTALARSQREHLAPWEPERPARWFTEAGQREALEQGEHNRAADRSYAYLITDDAGHLLGRLTLASVVRGAGQFCSIGYWIAR
ncbi:GNAT family N-acetyltransferase, partial [Micrococcus luteus]